MSLLKPCPTLEKSHVIQESDKSSHEIHQDLSYNSHSTNNHEITYSADLIDKAIDLVLSAYCMWDINAFIQSNYDFQQNCTTETPSCDIKKVNSFSTVNYSSVTVTNDVNVDQIRGTIYENFVIYSKNDINLQLLKQFDYRTETRATPTGRSQTVYICNQDECGKEFLRTCNLLDHMRMHSGIKPNMCEYCGKGFTQKSNLRKHLKVHLVPHLDARKRYTCDECGCKYTERYNFKRHMKKCHDVDI